MRHFVRAEANNLVLQFIRRRVATHVVYQSEFARTWWEREHLPTPVPTSVVLNGVPLDVYTPNGPEAPPADRVQLLVVEANLDAGYDIGLDLGARAGATAADAFRARGRAGRRRRVPETLRRQADAARMGPITWLGVVPPDSIPALDRSAHLLFASDVMPACPNSVVEALACGLPVVSFDTGALLELVTGDAGRIVPYGGDAWRLDPPDLEFADLVGGRGDLRQANAFERAGASVAQAGLNVETMIDGYLSRAGLGGLGPIDGRSGPLPREGLLAGSACCRTTAHHSSRCSAGRCDGAPERLRRGRRGRMS